MTKTALITTTINVPDVLRLYRALDSDVRFFIAGDYGSPHEDIHKLRSEIDNADYMSFLVQEHYYPELSKAIGPRCIQRRNIALLEALKWGADAIVSVDDDNLPTRREYFWDFQRVLDNVVPWYGIEAGSMSAWFDIGQLLDPISPHRGFPHTHRADPIFTHVVGAKVGVAAGICLGDPDIDAVTRIANRPIVHRVSELLRAGVVTNPNTTTTVFNSQNTAFIRELAPAMFMLPGVGRYDDIFASLITQRVMQSRSYHVHFGQPFVWQQRNAHNLVSDLKAEILGMEHVVEFAEWLNGLCLSSSVLGDVRAIYHLMSDLPWMPAQAREAGLAWCDDVEKVMG